MRIAAILSVSAVLAVAVFAVACGSNDPEKIDLGQEQDSGLSNTGGSSNTGGGPIGGGGNTVLPDGGGEVVYPPGPYGHNVGTIVQDYSFPGLLNPTAVNYKATKDTLPTIYLHDFYNPTGDPSKPLALVVNASARWCSVCQDEATTMNNYWKAWNPKGVQFLVTVFEDKDHQPATFTDLELWTSAYKFEFPSALDRDLKLGVFFDVSAAPFNMIINLKTMTIEEAGAGLMDLSENNTTLQKLVAK